MRAYVLINTAPGEGHSVAAALAATSDARLSILHADPVLGPYDLVLECESPNLDALGDGIEQVVRGTPFILHTVTCLSVLVA